LEEKPLNKSSRIEAVKKAERSKSIPLEESIRKSAKWKADFYFGKMIKESMKDKKEVPLKKILKKLSK